MQHHQVIDARLQQQVEDDDRRRNDCWAAHARRRVPHALGGKGRAQICFHRGRWWWIWLHGCRGPCLRVGDYVRSGGAGTARAAAGGLDTGPQMGMRLGSSAFLFYLFCSINVGGKLYASVNLCLRRRLHRGGLVARLEKNLFTAWVTVTVVVGWRLAGMNFHSRPIALKNVASKMT